MTWLVALTILLLPAYLTRFSVAGIPSTLLEALIYVAAVGLLITQPLATTGSRLRQFLGAYGWPLGLFIVSALAATVIAPDKRVALGLLKGYILDPIILLLVIVSIIDSPARLLKSGWALVASGAIIALTSFFFPMTADHRALGLYFLDLNPSPNFIALYVAPIAIFTLGFMHKQLESKQRLALGVAVILMLIAVLLSGSRGALLGLLASAGLAAFLSPLRASRFGLLIKIVGVLVILMSLVGSAWIARPNLTATSGRAATSNNLRYEIWRTTLVDILPHRALLGVGLGNYQNYFTDLTQNRVNFPEFISPWAHTPHNILLNIWVNLGIVGLVSFIWILWNFYAQTRLNLKNPIARAALLAMTALLFHGLVDAAFWKNDLAALFWVLIAFGWLARDRKEQL